MFITISLGEMIKGPTHHYYNLNRSQHVISCAILSVPSRRRSLYLIYISLLHCDMHPPKSPSWRSTPICTCKYIEGAISFSRKKLHMRYPSQYVTKDVTFMNYFTLTLTVRLCG